MSVYVVKINEQKVDTLLCGKNGRTWGVGGVSEGMSAVQFAQLLAKCVMRDLDKH